MAKIEHSFQTTASPQAVYEAVSTEEGLSSWWTRTSAVETRPGGEAEFTFQGDIFLVYRFDELKPGREVRLTSVRHQNNPEWEGTTLEFDLKPLADGGTEVVFRHEGWVEKSPWFDHCSNAWGHFMSSLKSYVEAGQGEPHEGGPEPSRAR